MNGIRRVLCLQAKAMKLVVVLRQCMSVNVGGVEAVSVEGVHEGSVEGVWWERHAVPKRR